MSAILSLLQCVFSILLLVGNCSERTFVFQSHWKWSRKDQSSTKCCWILFTETISRSFNFCLWKTQRMVQAVYKGTFCWYAAVYCISLLTHCLPVRIVTLSFVNKQQCSHETPMIPQKYDENTTFPIFYWDARTVRVLAIYMMTSSNGNIFRVTQWRGALMFSFDLLLNKRLSKQSWGWWFEMSSCPVWRHCNDMHIADSTRRTDDSIMDRETIRVKTFDWGIY